MDLRSVLQYWRDTVADHSLGEGVFSQKDEAKRFVSVSPGSLETGVLSRQEIRAVFKDSLSEPVLTIRLRPKVMTQETSHGAQKMNGAPRRVAPIVTKATVDRDGRITPIDSVMTRDVLTPLPSDVFSIGDVGDFDAFYTATPMPDMTVKGAWRDYLNHCEEMMNAVANGWPRNDPNYKTSGRGLIQVGYGAGTANDAILRLYDHLLSQERMAKDATPLLRRLARPQPDRRDPDPELERDFRRRLGHCSPDFALSKHQRQVLSHLDAAEPGDVIAVNGPPGTGKTTMLLSAVAGLWVRAALKGGDPPIVVAASTNNQAVTNVIDAFGKDFAKGDGPFAGRWLPGITSFGIYLPAYGKLAEAAKTYQTQNFQDECETEAYFKAARREYLRAARQAFPSLDQPDVGSVISALQAEMAREARALADLGHAAERLETAKAAIGDALGEDPVAEEDALRAAAASATVSADRLRTATEALEGHLASEPVMNAAFGFIPAIRKKRALAARRAVRDWAPEVETLTTVDQIEAKIVAALREAERSEQAAQRTLDDALILRRTLAEAEHACRRAIPDLSGDADLEAVDQGADRTIRFRLFLLATHYWEGRWLKAMEQRLNAVAASADGERAKSPSFRFGAGA